MKKNIKSKIGLMIFGMVILPLGVYADTVTINCPSDVDGLEEIECVIEGSSSDNVVAIDADMIFGQDLYFVSFENTLLEGNVTSDKLSLTTNDPVTGNFEIGKLKVKAGGSEDATVMLDKIVFTIDGENNKKEVESVKIEVGATLGDEGSVSSYLTDIKIQGYELNFNRETLEYTLKVSEDSLIITPVLEDENATYTINGNDGLTNGSVIEINVVTLNGEGHTYRINILKDDSGIGVTQICFIGIIAILVIINIVRIVKNSKRKKMDADLG